MSDELERRNGHEEPIECVLDRLSDNLSVAPSDVIRLRQELGYYDE